jgi:hypothetical protein
VLVAGCPADFMATCGEAGARLGVAVRECDLRSIRAVIATLQPFAVLVMEELYQSDPGAFDAVIREMPTSLLRIESHDVRTDEARKLLVSAIFESAATGPGSGVRPILG